MKLRNRADRRGRAVHVSSTHRRLSVGDRHIGVSSVRGRTADMAERRVAGNRAGRAMEGSTNRTASITCILVGGELIRDKRKFISRNEIDFVDVVAVLRNRKTHGLDLRAGRSRGLILPVSFKYVLQLRPRKDLIIENQLLYCVKTVCDIGGSDRLQLNA